MNIFAVIYSEEAGYFIKAQATAYPDRDGWWDEAGRCFKFEEGWRDSEEEAIVFWAEALMETAKNFRDVADKVEEISRTRTPRQILDPILMPPL